jgi:hypothetical protein
MKKGKCFSGCNKGQRKKSDFYQTPYSMTEQLLENEEFDKDKFILEPACGKMAIVKILEKYFNQNKIEFTDINDLYDSKDFFEEQTKYDYIITNPPFSLALEFIQKSKEIAREKFAMLLPLSYLHGQKRYEFKIFLDPNYPLIKIFVFTRYPLLTQNIRHDGKYNTGMMVYAWFIWEKRKTNILRNLEFPVIKWIDNNKYVLTSKDKLL